MTADPSDKSAELPPIDVTLEPTISKLPCTCADNGVPWHDSYDCPLYGGDRSKPEISPVPVKTRAELLAEIVRLNTVIEAGERRWQDAVFEQVQTALTPLLSAAESIELHCPEILFPADGYQVTLPGAQILALRSAIAAAK